MLLHTTQIQYLQWELTNSPICNIIAYNSKTISSILLKLCTMIGPINASQILKSRGSASENDVTMRGTSNLQKAV